MSPCTATKRTCDDKELQKCGVAAVVVEKGEEALSPQG
jgi:hypothetical protein